MSSPEGVAYLPMTLLAWNRLHTASAHLVAPALRFCGPQLVDVPKLVCIKAFD